MKPTKKITNVFNSLLLLYFFINTFAMYLFIPEDSKRVPWDNVYEWSPVFGILGALFIITVLAIIGSIFTNIFWNKFIADVFSLREISFHESLAIVLIIAILTI